MKRWSLAVLMAGPLLGAGLAQEASKGDHDKIQGTWQVVSLESRDSLKTGQKIPEDKLKELKVVITKDKLVVRSGKEPKSDLTYKINKLDPTKKPKWIDLALVGKDGSEKPTGAIYELDGDQLKLCIGDPSPKPKRPTEFEVAKLGLLVMVLKRDKD